VTDLDVSEVIVIGFISRPSLDLVACAAVPVMDIVVWLRSLGLGKYEAAFRENEIDETILPNLTVFQGPPAVVNQGATAE